MDAIIGPFFFEDETVNPRTFFFNILGNTIFPEVLNVREDAIFQLDGAPPHLALQERGVLNNVFLVGWFSRGWPTT